MTAAGGQEPRRESGRSRPATGPGAAVSLLEARSRPRFAHASEAEMARILDFYGVRWEYEPHVFPILWSLDGDVVESFSPDFYLPEMDLYLEITTLRQKLVRKKNRKLRRLRELYPGLQIKLFYARDFRALLLKYGKLALAASLSGSEGQVTAGLAERLVLGTEGRADRGQRSGADGHDRRFPRSPETAVQTGANAAAPAGAVGVDE